MLVLWQIQRRGRSAAIVDVAWSLATATLGVAYAVVADGDPARRLLVGGMAGGWGLRLGVHLWGRVAREIDGRYIHMREQWGRAADRYLFAFFQLQAFWAVMFALPMLAAAANVAPLGWLDLAGAIVWGVAIAGESVADRQLARFKSNPANAGRVCRSGLWKYSRHPNYFFEWLQWWAYLCLAIGSPLWWLAAAGVVVMLIFLTRVTGIPPSEAQAIRSRGEAYREYQRTTSAFLPLPAGGRRR
jgi:steroid 5-alpha reductase family enzyme